jgi:uracil-DNA glycosylase
MGAIYCNLRAGVQALSESGDPGCTPHNAPRGLISGVPSSTLRKDLEAMLGSWRARLPAAWRPHFDDVALPFDEIPALPGGSIWPRTFFRAFEDLAPSRVRAVVFGNDPYTRIAQATGRSFEQGDVDDWQAQLRTKVVSPSLRNIIVAAVRTRPAYAARSGLQIAKAVSSGEVALPADLFERWAAQGVLWLNRTLTFSRWDDGIRAAHKRLWARFTARVVRPLGEPAKKRPVAFVMWGGTAQQLEAPIAAMKAKHARIVKAAHPQMAASYFKSGNPLAAINAAVGVPTIKWLL